jgi:hypothetical protein
MIPLGLRLGLLALLFLAPRLAALTITQSASFGFSGSTTGTLMVPLSANWSFTPFAEPDSTLVSVTFSGSVSVVASVTELNPYAFPLLNGSFVILNSHLWLGSYHETLVTKTVATGGSTMSPYGAETTTTTVVNTFSRTLTDPSHLAFFSAGTQPLKLDNAYGGWTSYGWSNAKGTATLSLAYHHQIPDGGSALMLFASALVAAFACFRRRA